MKFYWIDALAPLVFRSGKPFGAQSDTDDIIFPLPSAAAGLIRTVSARQQDGFGGEFDSEALQKIPSNGLFLAQKEDVSGRLKIFVPKPADCVYLKNKETDKVELIRLSPQKHDDDCGSDLPNGLLPVQMNGDHKGKPQGGKQFWLLSDYFKWLNGEKLTFDDVDTNGMNLPSPDVRTHVAIDGKTLAGQDGLLFQTAAYDLANGKKSHHQGWQDERLGFVVATPENLQNDLVRFGGESRLSRIENIENIDENIFRRPEISGKKIRLTLLSPAIFAQGWLPQWLNRDDLTGTLPHTGLSVKLCAAAIERWQAVSGWDLANHQPKPMRKAVSAGAVYWFEVLNEVADLNEELAKLVQQSICDDEQDQRDGFGMIAVSEWED